MSIEDKKAIPRLYYEEAYNKGNINIADKVFDKNVIGHTSIGEIKGTQGVKQFSSMMLKAFSELKYIIEDQIAEGDKVVTRYTMTGIHKGEFMGIAPTGKKIMVTAISIFRIVNNKIVEGWANWDALGLMQQLGVSLPGKK